MGENLPSNAERYAAAGEDLPAFRGLKVLHVRAGVEELLSLIGRGGFFDEYTVHDIRHIDAMLKSLDWIVPEATQKVMSSADWLLVVLGIYFHDLGMLVTPAEYEARSGSGFVAFCTGTLFAGEEGFNYDAHVKRAYPDDAKRERFLYQEFVRATHAARIRDWVTGAARSSLGVPRPVTDEVQKLLSPLDDTLRRDLGLICESHHLEDLGDLRKYKTSQPYGNSQAETANVQYAALLLRTADLLHITRDRAPSITFRVINPADPISQREWAKQMAVRSVRPRPVRRPDEDPAASTAAADTVEVHARFTDADGFFGLTSYLSYASQQLRKSGEWAAAARRIDGVPHAFPWRAIDDSNVEASGFLPRPFAFEIDQRRILDLLTGHTLYNDTGVVLRELVQNSLDAIRLQVLLDKRENAPLTKGAVEITWDSENRVLAVSDNGTGMTQDIVEMHLLRVGSSRYQDPEFKKQHPEFSAISRFGIGVLSCFMIADDVEIVTVHPDEAAGRRLSLRTVHGRYLIRLLDKASDPALAKLGAHGTEVRLTLRPKAELGDVIATARRWVVVPACSVSAKVDAHNSVPIGYASVRDALRGTLVEHGYTIDDSNAADTAAVSGEQRVVRIVELTRNGLAMAVAVKWSSYFREWEFLEVGRSTADDVEEPLLGTCIEGIRVAHETPGYSRVGIAAIANATGPRAPKTNVARSGLEVSDEQEALLRGVYGCYADHLATEVDALQVRRRFSLTWAASEAQWLMRPLLDQSYRRQFPISERLLIEELSRLPILVVESEGKRRVASPESVGRGPEFWTSHSLLLGSVERLMRELEVSTSIEVLANALAADELRPPGGLFLASQNVGDDTVGGVAFQDKEVAEIIVLRDSRRMDLRWVAATKPPRWLEVEWDPVDLRHISNYAREAARRPLRVCQGPLKTSGVAGDEAAVRTRQAIFVVPGALGSYLGEAIGRVRKNDEEEQMRGRRDLMIATYVLNNLNHSRLRSDFFWDLSEQILPAELRRLAGRESTVASLAALSWGVFDPLAWSRAE